MSVVHEICHTIFYINEGKLFWRIHIVTATHGKVLNTIAGFNGDVHEIINPVIEGTPM